MAHDLYLYNVYVDDVLTTISVTDGMITRIGGPAGENQITVDGKGRFAIPALVDSHAHLDKTIIGLGRYDHEYEHTLQGCIENEHIMRKKLGHDPYLQAKRYIELVVPLGTLFMRSHVDVDPINGIRGMEGVLRACGEYQDVFHAQIVAFPQSGLLCHPKTVGLMVQALHMGAQVVGGLDPSTFDGDAKASVKTMFALAQKHGKPVDFHLHESGMPGITDTRLILAAAKAYGMEGQVTLSHAFCLSETENPEVLELMEQLATLNIHVVTTGTSANAPKAQPLLEAGVNLCGGNDNMRDLWSPAGTGDLLERVRYLAMHNGWRRESAYRQALRLCTGNGARLMKLPGYGLTQGCAADLVLVNAHNVCEAAAILPKSRTVIKGGRIVAQDGNLTRA